MSSLAGTDPKNASGTTHREEQVALAYAPASPTPAVAAPALPAVVSVRVANSFDARHLRQALAKRLLLEDVNESGSGWVVGMTSEPFTPRVEGEILEFIRRWKYDCDLATPVTVEIDGTPTRI